MTKCEAGLVVVVGVLVALYLTYIQPLILSTAL